MRKISLLLSLFVMAMVISIKSYAQISVTATAGVTSSVYLTLRNAINAINIGVHGGVITISVTASTTETTASVLNASGVGAASYTSILIKPAPATTPTISGNFTNAVLQLVGADNVTVDGSNTVGGTTRDLTITNNNSGATASVIWISSASAANGATNDTVRNCRLTGFSSTTTVACIVTGDNISVGSAAAAPNSNNAVVNNLFMNAQNGIYLSGATATDANWRISKNNFSTLGFRGMIVMNTTGAVISENGINGITGPLAGAGQFLSGILLYNTATGANVFKNVITGINTNSINRGCNGICLMASAGANNNIFNNFVSNVWSDNGNTSLAGPGDNGYGIFVGPNAGTNASYNIYYNTVRMITAQTSGLVSAAINVAAGMSAGSINLADNIFGNEQSGGTMIRAGIYCGATTGAAFATINYNDYYAASGTLGYINSINCGTIAAIQTNFGGNSNSISYTPTYAAAPPNLHLSTAVPANYTNLRTGTPITTPPITTDIDNVTRSGTGPTMGADELLQDTITYTPLLSTCATGDVTLNPVTIDAQAGVPTAGPLTPRIYFRKNAGSWFSQAGSLVSGTAVTGTWSFVISAAAMGGVIGSDVISYYVVAQDLGSIVFANPGAGMVATDVNTVTTPPAIPFTYTITPLPAPITGLLGVCAGSATTLSNAMTGGTWSSSTSVVAVIGSSTGVATGITPGTTIISYTLPTGCAATAVLTVQALPGPITGSGALCVGSTTTLAASPAGGTWVSNDPSIATVDMVTGVVTGITPGVTDISYTMATGCSTTMSLTVNALPGAITGVPSVCLGATTTLNNIAPGGFWSSSFPTIGSVGVTTGVVGGMSVGTTEISYTLGTGCYTTTVVTVNAPPTAITGIATVCVGSTTTLIGAPAGGTWGSSNTSVGTIDAASGVLTGVASGTTRITYSNAAGCSITRQATVNTTPTINPTAATQMCIGGTTGLFGIPFGGTWVSSTTSVATVSGGGLVSAFAAGTTTITYTITATGCFALKVITVNPMPTAITPPTPRVCVGSTLTMGNSVAGGTWTSGNTAVGSISTAGVATGIAAGTTRITYAIGTCSVTAVLTVNQTPTVNPTTATTLCVGNVFTLTSTLGGGVWSSSTPAVASVSGGVVTAASAGTTAISYTMPSGCFGTKIITVNSMPTAIIPSSPTVCVGSTTTLTNSVTGGSWVSSNTGVAVIGSADGVVSGITAGTSVVTYAIGSCSVVATVTVNPLPMPISGSLVTCSGSTTSLSTTSIGGTWSSSDVSVGSVDVFGVVTGISTGTANITYTLGTGCYTTVTATVSASPAAIAPSSPAICEGSSISLSNTVAGGSWTSSDPTVASVDIISGIVTGNAAGTSVVTYAIGTCIAVTTISVNPLPMPITPSSPTVCVGSTTTLVDIVAGGSWSSSDVSVASVDMFSGVVTGIAMGMADITYTIPTGCYVTVTATVNSLPAAITPSAPVVCEGSSIFLSNSVAGGTWTSDNITVATVDAAGNVSGMAAGSAVITYSVGSCFSTTVVTVNAGPAAILPSAPTVCAGASITLTDATAGGMWTSGSPAVATIGSTTGIMTGVATGTAAITYTVGGCDATVVATVSAATTAGSITGPSILCLGSFVTYTHAVSGGVWSTSTGNATISSSGVADGVSVGADVISYTISNACGTVIATKNITVNATPSAGTLSGPATVCAGSSITMSSTVSGGVWSSSDNAIATAAASGLITGVSAGTVNITYSVTDAFGCTGIATVVTTVNALPTVAAITGTPAECVGSTTTLANATPGGLWSSSATGIATVSASGLVTGAAVGTSVISYVVTDGFGCSGMATVINTVSALPATSPITGTMAVCAGSNTTLSNTTSGGVWSSSDLSIAGVGASTGIVTGGGAGTATISYVVANACGSATNTAVVTVNALPAVAPITSLLTTLCAGATGSVSNSTPGGVWSSSNPSVATVSTTGVVTGISAGTANITYTVTNAAGCTAFVTYTLAVAPGFGPLAVFPTPGATMCDSAAVYMFVTPPTPGLTYQWRIAGVDIPGATNTGYTATSPGNYSVLVGNGMCSMVFAGTTVAAPPSPTIGFNPPGQLFTGSFAAYQWYLNGVAIPGATTSVLNFTSGGSYTVKVTDVNGCGVTSQVYNVKNTGTPDVAGVGEIKVYPNPATSTLHIDAAIKVNTSVLAMDGKILIAQKDVTSVDISKLPAGMYMIMIYDQNNLLMKAAKFTKAE